MKRFTLVLFSIVLSFSLLRAQSVPVSTEYTMLYDFLDELATDGHIHLTPIRPYTRQQVAEWLTEAAARDTLPTRRQCTELAFYLDEFALECNRIPDFTFIFGDRNPSGDNGVYAHRNLAQWTDSLTFNLSAVQPAFHYMAPDRVVNKRSNGEAVRIIEHPFKLRLTPILGMDIIASTHKGAILKRWYGAELQMDIVNHISIWGSLRDKSWSGQLLNKDVFPGYNSVTGARIAGPTYLNLLPGVQYKEAGYGGDFSDSKGGIALYDWWGRVAFEREEVRWGDTYHCSNILSGHNPAVPMLSLRLTPCRWFQFDYFHAWLNSNQIDSTFYYTEQYGTDDIRTHYRPHPKYMAANMFTFIPIKGLNIAFGNSVVYAERTPQAIYFLPIAFYKSLDHLKTKGLGVENQNSQMFLTVSSRNVPHLHLYASVYVDEFQFARLKPSNPEHNPVSYQVGFNWSGWPVGGLSLKGEFTRSNIACYTHSIPTITYESNSYNMGHYLGDNAQNIYVELAYRPVRGLHMRLSYSNEQKYRPYAYVRDIIDEIIAVKPFKQAVWKNDVIDFVATYEVFQNCYARVNLTYNNARTTAAAYADNDGKPYTGYALADDGRILTNYLNQYTPAFYQGRNLTITCGLNFNF